MIVSCYFTSIEDPQRKVMMPKNSQSYIGRWYESLNDEAVVFHDELTEEFASWFPGVKFVKVSS